MSQKIKINPFDVLLWNWRHSGRDIMNIYTRFSPMMQMGTNTEMLNFGLWKNSTDLSNAQKEMSEYVAEFGEFDSARKVLDVGSGFCTPAMIWKKKFSHLDIFCLDLNFSELNNDDDRNITQINSSSNNIPFSNKIFDRIIALESAQHFIPLMKFFEEAKRVLSDDGNLILAIPIKKTSSILNLGILNITWLSKKYTENHVLDTIKQTEFILKRKESVGELVYEPFADYYIQNRQTLKQKIVAMYPSSVEDLIFKSMKKMKNLSERKVIDYLLLNLTKN